MTYKFSPSSLSLLKECPRCFWLQFNKNIKRPAGIFPSLPSGMDGILKAYFDMFMERGELPPKLQHLGGGLKLFDDKAQLDIWRSNFKGIQWTDEKGNLFRGAVDNLLKLGNKIIVLDYKTRGYPLKEDTAEHYQDQMDIYNFLLKKNGYETEDYAYLLFYHPKEVDQSGAVIFNNDLVKMNISVQNAENIFKKAVETLEKPLPEASEACEYCRWAGQTGAQALARDP
ncbi:PD-(D/E)XK nuclease family protein [Candidatus Woesearchaeota archaeon]|nr:PD-(D/E)XK nuclease family protein [Candidatus Woesearchaeota archaeon]